MNFPEFLNRPPSPTQADMSEKEYIISFLLSNLEDDAAFVENDLHVLRYALQGLGARARTPGSTQLGAIQRETLQILGEIDNADHDLPELVKRLEEISTDLEALKWSDIVRGLQKQYAVIDKTLMAADDMCKELRSQADTVYFEAHDLEKPIEVAGMGAAKLETGTIG